MSRLAHVSDIHFGAQDEAIVDGLARAIETQAVDAIIVTGDLTQSGKRREFKQASEYFATLGRPTVFAPGNHDTPMLNLGARLTRPFGRYHKFLADGAAAMFEGDDFRVWTLNTARGAQFRLNWAEGAARRSHVASICEDVRNAHPPKAAIVACHHPLIAPETSPITVRTRRGPAAEEQFAKVGVDLVLSGHTHVPTIARSTHGDRRSYAIGAGTAASVRTRGAPASFNVISIERDAFCVCALSWREGEFAPGDPVRLDRRRMSEPFLNARVEPS